MPTKPPLAPRPSYCTITGWDVWQRRRPTYHRPNHTVTSGGIKSGLILPPHLSPPTMGGRMRLAASTRQCPTVTGDNRFALVLPTLHLSPATITVQTSLMALMKHLPPSSLSTVILWLSLTVNLIRITAGFGCWLWMNVKMCRVFHEIIYFMAPASSRSSR